MADPAASFACPACHKRFGWKPDLAGRKVRCSGCSLKMRVPAAGGTTAEALEPLPGSGVVPARPAPPPQPKQADEYEVSLDDDLSALAPARPAGPPPLPSAGGGDKCPSCGQKVKPAAVICINCGFNLKAGKRLKTAVEVGDDDPPAPGGQPASAAAAGPPRGMDPERWKKLAGQIQSRDHADHPSDFKEKKAPPILLVAGVLLILLDAFVLLYKEPDYLLAMLGTTDPTAAGVARILGAGFSFVLGLPFMVIGLMIVAKLFGSAFGGMLMAIYKLAAVLLLTIGVNQVFDSFMTHITGGVGDFVGYLSWVVSFVAFWGAAAFVFDEIEPGEVVILFLLTFFAPAFILGFILLTALSAFM